MPKVNYATDTLGFACPCCNKQLVLPVRAIHNVESYQKTVSVRAECCGQIVYLQSRIQLFASRANGVLVDDWSVEAEDLEP